MKMKYNSVMSILGCIAFVGGAIVCILNLTMVEHAPPLLTVVQMALYALMIGVPFWALLIFVFQWRKHRAWVLLPIIVSVMFSYLVRESSFSGQRKRIRIFESQKKEYITLVDMLRDGTLPVKKDLSGIELPNQYKHLGGRVLARQTEDGGVLVRVLVSGGWPVIITRYVYRDATNYPGDLTKGTFVFDHPGWYTSRK